MMLTSAPKANIPLQLKPCHVIEIIRILHFKYFNSSYDSITKNQIWNSWILNKQQISCIFIPVNRRVKGYTRFFGKNEISRRKLFRPHKLYIYSSSCICVFISLWSLKLSKGYLIIEVVGYSALLCFFINFLIVPMSAIKKVNNHFI